MACYVCVQLITFFSIYLFVYVVSNRVLLPRLYMYIVVLIGMENLNKYYYYYVEGIK